MKEWMKALIEYDKTGNVGSCPKCGEKAIAVTAHIRENGTKSITFQCEACKRGVHFN